MGRMLLKLLLVVALAVVRSDAFIGLGLGIGAAMLAGAAMMVKYNLKYFKNSLNSLKKNLKKCTNCSETQVMGKYILSIH